MRSDTRVPQSTPNFLELHEHSIELLYSNFVMFLKYLGGSHIVPYHFKYVLTSVLLSAKWNQLLKS